MTVTNGSARVELMAEFTARPGCEEEVERLLLAFAVEVRREPGCLDFTPHRVEAPPVGVSGGVGPPSVGSRFIVTEVYSDGAAFAAHLAARHGAAFNSALAPLIEEPASVLTFLRSIA
ncbi:putative quinol monooxygenase [Agromyces sp. NPDC055520]